MRLWLSIKTNGPGGQIMSCAMVREDGRSFLWIEQVIREKIHPTAEQAWKTLGWRPVEVTPLYSNSVKLAELVETHLEGVTEIVSAMDDSLPALVREGFLPRAEINFTPAYRARYDHGWTAGNAWCDASAIRNGSLVA
jgi:hypothetical protein